MAFTKSVRAKKPSKDDEHRTATQREEDARIALETMKQSALLKKAAAVGATSEEIDRAVDEVNPKAALADLIISKGQQDDTFDVARTAGLLLFCVEFNDQMLNSFFVSWLISRGATMSQAGELFFMLSIGFVGVAPFSPYLISRIGCNRLQYYASWGFITVRMSYLFLMAVPMNMTQTVMLPMAKVIFLVQGMCATLSETSSQTWTLTSVPPDKRTAASSTLVTLRSLAAFVSPPIGGILYDLAGFAAPITLGGVVFATVLIWKRRLILSKVPSIDKNPANSGSILRCTPVCICTFAWAMQFSVLQSLIVWFQPFLLKSYHVSSSLYGICTSLLACIFACATLTVAPLEKALGKYLAMCFSVFVMSFGFLWIGPTPVLSMLPPPSFSTFYIPWLGLIIFFIGYAFPISMINPMIVNFASEAGWSENDAAAQNAMLNMISVGLAFGIGPILGSYSVESVGVANTCVYNAAAEMLLMGGPIALLALWEKRSSKSKTTEMDSKAEGLLPKDSQITPPPELKEESHGFFGGMVCCFYSKRATDYEDYHEDEAETQEPSYSPVDPADLASPDDVEGSPDDVEGGSCGYGGPCIYRTWCCLTHLAISCLNPSLSYIPYVGENPPWAKFILWLGCFGFGFHHFAPYFPIDQRKFVDPYFHVCTTCLAFSLLFFYSHVGATLPWWQTTLVVSALFFGLLGGNAVYTKKTGLEPASYHSEMMKYIATPPYALLHAGQDTFFMCLNYTAYFVMGCPPLMTFMRDLFG